jgi:hypothetical protein
MEALNSPKEVLQRFAKAVTILPGLSTTGIAALETQLPGALPTSIKELLAYSTGFKLPPHWLKFAGPPGPPSGLTVRFTPTGDFGFARAIPFPVALLNDGFGNFWVVDINPTSGDWETVFFVCHDPAAVIIQASGLTAFLRQVLDPDEADPQDALSRVRNDALTRVVKEDPWLVPVLAARKMLDPAVAEFASQLPDNFNVVDLRSGLIGMGFRWNHTSPEYIQRLAADLLFGLEQRPPPGIVQRVLTLLFSR